MGKNIWVSKCFYCCRSSLPHNQVIQPSEDFYLFNTFPPSQCAYEQILPGSCIHPLNSPLVYTSTTSWHLVSIHPLFILATYVHEHVSNVCYIISTSIYFTTCNFHVKAVHHHNWFIQLHHKLFVWCKYKVLETK